MRAVETVEQIQGQQRDIICTDSIGGDESECTHGCSHGTAVEGGGIRGVWCLGG